MRNTRNTLALSLYLLMMASVAFAAGAPEAQAETYPDQPITLIVPFAAGGGMDITARALGQVSQTYLGVPLVVVNRTGGSGTIAATEVARANPDGYTLLAADSGSIISAPLTQAVEYSLDDFVAVSGLNVNDVILITRTGSGFDSVADVVNSPTRIRFGTVGTGSVLHALAVAFFDQAQIDSTNVPFASTQETVTAVLSGIIEVGVAHPNQARTGLADGSLQAIGVFSDQRAASLPNVPTMVEQGYEISLQVYNMILAPAGIAPDRLAFLEGAFVKMLNDPSVQQNAISRNLVLWPESGEAVDSKMAADVELTRQLYVDLGVIVN